jgi:hypothetical protein
MITTFFNGELLDAAKLAPAPALNDTANASTLDAASNAHSSCSITNLKTEPV